MADSRVKSVAFLSQLPPPVHGSTIMTKLLVESIEPHAEKTYFIDRRFSKHVSEVGRFSVSKILGVPSLVLRATRVALKGPACFILFLTNRPASFLVDFLIIWIFSLFRVPMIAYIHTQGFRGLASRGWLWEKLVSHALRCFSSVVCLSESLAEDVRPWVTNECVSIIPNATVKAESIPTPEPSSVLFLSNLIDGKGILDFIEISNRLFERIPHSFDAFGFPGEEYLVQQARLATSDSSSRFTYHGPLTNNQRTGVMSNTALLVFPSTYKFEALPLTIVEALSYGVPVVAYDVGGIGDILHEGGGTVVQSGDIDALENAIEAILGSPDARRSLSSAAVANYTRNLTPAAYTSRWLSVIERVANGAHQPT